MKLLILIMSLVLMTACQGDEPSVELPDQPMNYKYPVTELIRAIKSGNFDPVVYFCEQYAGAKYDYKTLSCECRGDKVFVGYEYGKCIDIEKENNFSYENQNYTIVRPQGLKTVVPFIKENHLKIENRSFLMNGQFLMLQNLISSNPEKIDINRYLSLSDPEPIAPRTDSLEEIPVFYVDSDIVDKSAVQNITGFASFEYFLNRFGNLQIESKSDIGCMVTCKVKKYFSKMNTEFIWERTIAGGQVLKNFIHIKNRETRFFDKTIVLTPDNVANFQIVYERYKKNDEIIQNVDFQDFNGESYLSSESTLVTDVEEQLEIKSEFKTSRSEFVGLLCDAGVNLVTAKDKDLLDKLAFGNLNSFSGLLNSKNSSFDYFSDLNPLSDEGVSFFGQNSDHSYMLLDKVEYSKFIPFNFIDCLLHTNNWQKQAIKEKVKVINLSVSDRQQVRACEKSQISKNLETNEAKEFLWVFASGNARIVAPKEKQPSCPQNSLSGKKHILIAGAGYNSDQGKDYLDIYVKDHYDYRINSSSEAAVILSDFAVKLFNDYSPISVRNVRRAIILSAEVESYNNNSRAGGYLDRDRAKLIANYLKSTPELSNKEIIDRAFWWSGKRKKLNHIERFGGEL